MTASRELILDALKQRLAAVPDVQFVSRVFMGPTAVSAEQMPCILLCDHNEDFAHEGKFMSRRATIMTTAFVYAKSTGEGVVGSTVLNNLLEGIEQIALKPDSIDQNVCTLGRLVYRCWIEGKVIKDPGDFDGQAMMAVPIKILIP